MTTSVQELVYGGFSPTMALHIKSTANLQSKNNFEALPPIRGRGGATTPRSITGLAGTRAADPLAGRQDFWSMGRQDKRTMRDMVWGWGHMTQERFPKTHA